jgi:YD repeat-containing protein
MPGYSTATNRYTLGGTSYDADGNVLTDTFHTYTWNSDGQPATVNTNTLVTLTYDALGRVVVLNDAGTKTDIAYTPSGRRFAYYPAGAFGRL